MGQHRTRGQGVRLLVAAILLGLPWPARAEPDSAAAVTALYGCFTAGAARAAQAGPGVAFGPGTAAYFFEQLGRVMQLLGRPPEMGWCEPWFVAPYARAHEALHGAHSRAPAHAPHLPLSTGAHLGAEARLLQLAARMGADSHVVAHGEMMRHAFSQPRLAAELGRLGLDVCARGLLMQAAQAPDLYLFDRAPYHAHSRDPGPAQWTPRAPEVEEDRQAFVALVVATLRDARRALDLGEGPRAMVLLGAAAHAVQDLNFHFGMTLAEQAGLTYVAHDNPDLPAEGVRQRVTAKATHDTALVLATTLSAVAHYVPQAMPDGAEDGAALEALVRATFDRAEPVTYATLLEHFMRGQRYAAPEAPEARHALAHAHLGRWPVTATLEQILAAL